MTWWARFWVGWTTLAALGTFVQVVPGLVLVAALGIATGLLAALPLGWWLTRRGRS